MKHISQRSRNAAGKPVGHHTFMVPSLDGSTMHVRTVINFNLALKSFAIALPEHVLDTLCGEDRNLLDYPAHNKHGTAVYDNGRILAAQMDDAIAMTSAVLSHCRKVIQNTSRVKVIVFNYHRNTVNARTTQQDLSFVGYPALHLSYNLFWRVGDKLYKYFPDDMETRGLSWAMHYAQSVPEKDEREHVMIDWTEDRERFFQSMTASLETLISRIDGFVGALKRNPVAALEGFRAGLLAPPVKK